MLINIYFNIFSKFPLLFFSLLFLAAKVKQYFEIAVASITTLFSRFHLLQKFCLSLLFMISMIYFSSAGILCTTVSAADEAEYIVMNIGEEHSFECHSCEDVAFVSANPYVASFNKTTHTLHSKASGYSNIFSVCPRHGRKYYRVHVSSPDLILNYSASTIYCNSDSLSSVQLRAIKLDGAHKNISWTSSDKSIASVNSAGKVTARSEGVAIITATSNNISASCMITVIKADLIVSSSNITLNPNKNGNKCQLSPQVIGPKRIITYSSSNKKVATVTPAGLITAKSPGEAVITLSSNGVSKSVTVSVKPYVSLSSKSAVMYLCADQKPVKLNAYSGGKTVSDKGSWTSSDTNIVSVSNGELKAISEGTATITYADDFSSDSCIVTVKNVYTTLDKSSITMDSKGKNNKIQLNVSLDGPVKNKVKWTSSDKKIATVNSKGLITGISPGVATISVSANNITAECTVNVVETSLLNIPKKYTFEDLGMTYSLKPTILGTTDSAKYSSSNTSVATVSSKGVITSCSPGKATITVEANGLSASCNVSVNQISTSLNKDVIGLNVDTYPSEVLKLTVKGADKKVTWTSNNDEVATVSDKGKVTAHCTGSAIISAIANGKIATCTVCVTDSSYIKSDPKITVSADKLSLNLHGTQVLAKLDAIVTGTKEPVVWYSDNPAVASVDQDGVVKASAKGSAKIYACIGNKKTACKVTVIDNKITLNASLVDLDLANPKKNKYKIKASISGTHKEVEYYSANENVATVIDGVINAVDEGSTTITAIANGITALCDVNVSNVNHNHNYVGEVVNVPTCTDDGLTNLVCSSCKDDYSVILPMTGHSMSEPKQDVAPSCTKEGTMVSSCDTCDYSVSTPVPATGHSMSEPKQDVAPSCTKTGTMVSTCGNCDYSVSTPIPATGHSMSEPKQDVAPSCTKEGTMVSTCGNCDYSVSTPISATGHDFHEYTGNDNGIIDGVKGNKCINCDLIIAEYFYVSVNGDNCSFTQSSYYKKETKVNLFAIPNEYYQIDGWYENGNKISDGPSCTIDNISSAHSLSVKASRLAVKVEANDIECNYDAQEHYALIRTIPEDADITYSIDGIYYRENNFAFVESGTYTLYYKASRNNYLSTSGSVTIKIISLEGSGSINIPDFFYSDSFPVPEIASSTNSLDGVEIYYKEAGSDDSTYSKELPCNVGSYIAKAVFPATDNYNSCSATDSFSIKPYDISNLAMPNIDNQLYTGLATEPTPTLIINGITLDAETDLSYEYSDNTDIGTASITINGLHNYTGSLSGSYYIERVTTTLLTGPTIRTRISEACGYENDTYLNAIENLKCIEFVKTMNLPNGIIIDQVDRTSIVYSPEDMKLTIYCYASTVESPADFSYAFYNITSLEEIKGLDILDTSNTISINHIFHNAGYNSARFILDISSFNLVKTAMLTDAFNSTGYYADDFRILIPYLTGTKQNYSSVLYGSMNSKKIYSSTQSPSSANGDHYFTPIQK